MKKRIFAYLLALIMMCSIQFHASAESSLPELKDNGSITFEMKLNGTPLNSGNLNICRVADIQPNGDKYEFVLIDALKSSNVDLTNVTDLTVAKNLLKYVQQYRITKITSPIVEGTCYFPELPVGLYLVWQNDADATKGYNAIQPFLISVPRSQDGELIFDIVAKPKVPLVTTPPPPSITPPPPPPYVPQTGQLNWPVPVMGGVGFALFAVGLMICGNKRRSDDES